MSRLWSRFGVRALAVGLLLAGASGGYFLAEERRTQQAAVNARLVAQAEQEEREILREHQRAYLAATAQQRAAEREAAKEAAEAAKAATEWARQAAAAASRRKAREEAERKAAMVPYTGPIPESCNEYSGNRRIGCALLLEAGFDISEMPCLDKLWTKESGWNPKASNSATGAYGIPQALPGSKMASVGDDWETNPATQIKWGLGYVKGRYDTPCGAWTFFQERGYY